MPIDEETLKVARSTSPFVNCQKAGVPGQLGPVLRAKKPTRAGLLADPDSELAWIDLFATKTCSRSTRCSRACRNKCSKFRLLSMPKTSRSGYLYGRLSRPLLSSETDKLWLRIRSSRAFHCTVMLLTSLSSLSLAEWHCFRHSFS